MKILHVINSLKKGGAEGNLFRLCEFQKKKYKNKINIKIVTLISNGFYENELKKIGISVTTLNLHLNIGFFEFIKKLINFRQFIKKQNPDVIQSWMYHSNFITLFIQRKYYKKIFWNIRHSELNFKISKKRTYFLSLICGFFSRIVPKGIIYCSEKSIFFHENRHFYSKKKTILIHNGYNHKTYYPSKFLRLNFRKKYKIYNSDIAIGYAGRYAKQKNIKNLLYAFSKITKYYSNIYLYMVGKNINYKNQELSGYLHNLKINNKVFLLDEKKKLIKFYNGIDLLLLTSYSESFPNVVAESMLCATPVLSTNSGCSKKIINNNNFIINNYNSEKIFKSLMKIININISNKSKWKKIKKKCQIQIKNNFSISNMANSYLNVWTF